MNISNKPTVGLRLSKRTQNTDILDFFWFIFTVILLSSQCLSGWCFPGFAVTLDNLSRQPECRANDVMVDNALFVHLDWVGIARCASPQQLHTILYLWPYSTDKAHFFINAAATFFLKSLLLFLLSHVLLPGTGLSC